MIDGIEVTAQAVYKAVVSGQYLLAASLALVLAVGFARVRGAKHWSFLSTERGVSMLVLLGAFGGALANTLAAGQSPSWRGAWAALTVAVSAAGGHALVKNLLIEPYLRPWAAKRGQAVRALLAPVFSLFDKPAKPAISEPAVDEHAT